MWAKKNNIGAPICRLCSAADCSSLGMIPDSDMFAGRIIETPLFGGQLWHCQDCDSQFRYPILVESGYLKLYQAVETDIWENSLVRKDQKMMIAALQREVLGGSVLDVGCFAGQLLATLPQTYKTYGLEPSQAAARIASTKGVQILGATVDDIAPDAQFDCIVSMDVMEHVLDPAQFLEKALRHIKPGGFLFFSTGNPDSLAWRYVFKSRFWYVSNAEHVSFPSQKWIAEKTKTLGAEVVAIANFRYADIGLKRTLVKLFGQILYGVSPKFYATWRGKQIDGSEFPSVYSFGVFKDHHLITIRKSH